jgi:Winged helix DNA-binding domain
MYIGLWSRLDGFERDRLTRALERRSVLQATLMRVTIHLVSAPDFWPFAVGLREPRRDAWFRARRDDPSRREVAAAADRVRGLLADGPRPRAELIEGMDARLFNGVGIWLDLVRVPPGGTWEHRRADVYATGESWIGPPGGTPEEGLELLIRRYLQGFGPAAPAEVADWIGVPTLPVAATLDRLELRRFRAEDGGLLVDLPRAPLPPADTAAPARFIPTWDSTLLVHCRRTAFLPEEHRPKVFHTRTPQSKPTFAVDGEVAGTWRYKDGRIALEPFGRLPAGARAELEDEAERLAAFMA